MHAISPADRLCLAAVVHLGRCTVIEWLVQPTIVVEVKVRRDGLPGFTRGGVVFQVHLFVLEGAPQSLREHVVDGTSSAIHADAHARSFH